MEASEKQQILDMLDQSGSSLVAAVEKK